jgi:TPR repeat protein
VRGDGQAGLRAGIPPERQGERGLLRALSAAGAALLALAGTTASADNFIKDLSSTPLAEVQASCRGGYWVACTELGERAHYGKGVPQDFEAARRFYEQAKKLGDFDTDSELKTLGLDRRCAALGVKVTEPGTTREPAEDCATDYYEAKASGDFKEAVACVGRSPQPETVAMLYANGYGVKRDLDRAIKAACEYRDVSAERDGLLEAVFRLKDLEIHDEELDFCNYITSGYGQYRCASYRAETTGDADEKALEAAKAKWSAPARAEWEKLRPVADAFFEAEADAVTYGSRLGTGYAGMAQEELTDLHHGFLAAVAKAAEFDPGSVKETKGLPALDRELNAGYARALAGIEEADEKEAARTAERAWIRYRDAMAAFYRVLLAGRFPPQAVTDAVVARLTKERVDRLAQAEAQRH